MLVPGLSWLDGGAFRTLLCDPFKDVTGSAVRIRSGRIGVRGPVDDGPSAVVREIFEEEPMSKSGKAMMVPVVLCATMALATRAQAQASAVDMAAASCPVNENTPRAVQEASVMIIEALNAKEDSGKKIPLRSAGKALSVPAAAGAPDSAGRAYELGRVLVLWLDMGRQPVVTSKGSIGFVSAPGDTGQKIDLSVWIDSTFKIVEKAIPSCAPSLAADWRQHPGWFRLVQRAVEQAHDGKFDSASVTVTQASRIYSKYPYTAFVQAQVAEARGDHATATAKFNEVIQLAQQDSVYDHIRAAAQAGLAAVGAPAGSVPAPVTYKTVLNNPSANYADLVSAGLAASSEHQMSDAIRAFRRAVEMNPYQRDGLYDLGMLLTTADSNAAARPFVDRLLQVDPSNPNNYVLAQQVYVSLQRGAQKMASRDSAQAVTLAADAARSRAYRDSAAAWTDSAKVLAAGSMNLLNRKDAITVGIQFSQWIPKDGSVTLGGVLTNTAAAAKTVKLHVDFLDKGGNTVSSNEVTLTVDPKRSTSFTLTGNGAGIAAFKYTPLS